MRYLLKSIFRPTLIAVKLFACFVWWVVAILAFTCMKLIRTTKFLSRKLSNLSWYYYLNMFCLTKGKAYLKRTNFRVYIFSRISRILVDFAKLNTREIFLTSFAKINTREICTKSIFRENKYTRKNKYDKCFFVVACLPACFSECPLIQLYSFLFYSFLFTNLSKVMPAFFSLTFCRFAKFLHFGDSQKFIHAKF